MRHGRTQHTRPATALQMLTRRWREWRSLHTMEHPHERVRAVQPSHVRLVGTDDPATLDQLLLRATPARQAPTGHEAAVSPWDGGRATG